MAIIQPDYIWFATGGLSNLSKDKVTGLGFRKIVLFPDSGCAEKWKEKVKELINIIVSDGLESYPKGYDLTDVAISSVSKDKFGL